MAKHQSQPQPNKALETKPNTEQAATPPEPVLKKGESIVYTKPPAGITQPISMDHPAPPQGKRISEMTKAAPQSPASLQFDCKHFPITPVCYMNRRIDSGACNPKCPRYRKDNSKLIQVILNVIKNFK